MRIGTTLAAAGWLAMAGAASAQYAITWQTIDGGGAMHASGGTYQLSGTIGQADPGSTPPPATGGTYGLTAGFWVVTAPSCSLFVDPDFNQDCHVDGADLVMLVACGSGPAVPYDPAALPSGCTQIADPQEHIPADFDADGDVDGNDFAVLQGCWSGSWLEPDQACDD